MSLFGFLPDNPDLDGDVDHLPALVGGVDRKPAAKGERKARPVTEREPGPLGLVDEGGHEKRQFAVERDRRGCRGRWPCRQGSR